MQDSTKSGSFSMGINAGVSDSGKSGSGGASFSVSNSSSKWVREQTSLTGGKVNIYVENKTTLKGAVINSTTGDLKFDTGSFEYKNIKDKNVSFSNGASVSAGGNSQGKENWSVGVNYGYSNKRQTNFATVGEGTIIVRDGKTDMSKLNRDVTRAQYTTVDVGLSGGIKIDSKTIEYITTSPTETYNNVKNALVQGFNDGRHTTEKVIEITGNMVERTVNSINGKGFSTDGEIRIQTAITSGNVAKYGSLDFFSNKIELGYYGQGKDDINLVRDNQGMVMALVERSSDGTNYGVYKYDNERTLSTSHDFDVNNLEFKAGTSTTKEGFRDNTDYVFNKIQEVSDFAGIKKNAELFNFTVEGAKSYFSNMQFADQAQLNYTYAGIMDNLGNQFDGKISYSQKAVVINGTMAMTSAIDCSSYQATGIHILGLNNSNTTGIAVNPQYNNPSDFTYTPTNQRITSYENGVAMLSYNESVITRYDASSVKSADKTGMIGVTIVDQGKIFHDYKLDHAYTSLDKEAKWITESYGGKGISDEHKNPYLGQIKDTKYFLQLNLPDNRKAK